jgi:beta-galactosidase
MWMDVKYEPGTIKVVAYEKDGKPAAEQQVVTAGKPYKLVLEPDRSSLQADGQDIAFVTVSAVDKNGNFCPLANDQLTFKVTGAGSYRAACNGDATSLEPFHLPTMKLFNGKLVVLVQASTKAGDIQLTIKGEKLKEGSINLRSANL